MNPSLRLKFYFVQSLATLVRVPLIFVFSLAVSVFCAARDLHLVHHGPDRHAAVGGDGSV